jgi:hypothetical protein
MPTILIIGPYRFFCLIDFGEPPHVHIQREKMVAKFWLTQYLEHTGGFKRRIEGYSKRLKNTVISYWSVGEHFGD